MIFFGSSGQSHHPNLDAVAEASLAALTVAADNSHADILNHILMISLDTLPLLVPWERRVALTCRTRATR